MWMGDLFGLYQSGTNSGGVVFILLLNIPFVRLINILTLLDFFIFFIIRKQFLPSETSLFNISQLRKPHFIDTYHVFTSSSVYFEIFAYYKKIEYDCDSLLCKFWRRRIMLTFL